MTSQIRETVDNLVQELNRSTKSIIGKLSREGVYRREVMSQRLGKPYHESENVTNIAENLGVENDLWLASRRVRKQLSETSKKQ